MIRPQSSLKRAFTLVELLTVIAIIGILAALTFGAISGVAEQQNVTRTKADMTAIKVALQRYKSDFGDFPRVGANGGTAAGNLVLLSALAGLISPDGAPLDAASIRNPFIDIQDLNISFANENAEAAFMANRTVTNLGNVILRDAWDGTLRYYYDQVAATTTWRNSNFVLFSDGPDGLSAPPATIGTTGVFDPKDLMTGADSNLDNIMVE